MSIKEPSPTCFDVLQDLDTFMRDQLPDGEPYYVLGGIPSKALCDPDTWIDTDKHQVLASEQSDPSIFRDKGSRRDVDIFLGGVHEKIFNYQVKNAVSKLIGKQLKVSVSSFSARETTETNGQFRFGLMDWIADRTIDEDGVYRYELHPLEVAVDPSSYEPWELVTPQGSALSIFHPIGHVLAYRMRSVSGLRHKDREKVPEMEENVFESPELGKEMEDGIFREWKLFADAMAALRSGRFWNPDLKREGINIFDPVAFWAKSHILSGLEHFDVVVDLAQRGSPEKVLDKLFNRVA